MLSIRTVFCVLAISTSMLMPAAALAAGCSNSDPVGLVMTGVSAKQPGDSLQIDYCFKTGSVTDLYAVLLLPDGTVGFFTAVGSAPAFSLSAAPFKSSAAAQDGTLTSLIKMTLPAGLPTGTYTFFAVAVSSGGSVLDSKKWVGGKYASTAMTFSPGTDYAATSAFFYQTVDPAASIVRAGATANGKDMGVYNFDVSYAKNGSSLAYGDPTFSRLKNGRWAMTTWGKNATMGLHYHESSCPKVDDAQVKSLPASSASGCRVGSAGATASSKTSQVFDVSGSNYLLTQAGAEIYLTRLTDETRTAADLSSICVRQTAATSLSQLAWGESTKVISSTLAGGLLLSDVGIAKRANGTWVMFVKGISSSSGCAQGSVCELCARNIYRTTSTDLITWSALEKVVSQASVPDAVTYPDGSVWLYHQNFSAVCTNNDIKYAERAPITGLYELADYTLASAGNVKFAAEAFETDTSIHYPTNGNPIAIPDAAAMAALDLCMGTKPR